MVEELKLKIMAILHKIPFLQLRSTASIDYYSGEIQYNEFAGSVSGGVSGASHILMMHGTSSCLVSIPIKAVIASIKWRLAVMEYGEFLVKNEIEEEEVNRGCVVCWERIEKRDEIREMVNCKHVFHRDCLDRWLDEGHITCPLCRSSLIPPNTNPLKIVGDLNLNHEFRQEIFDVETDFISVQDIE
ncbi:E3 ubiquitin protein ligase RIN3-like [Impatiens glandulifera]|uniref:E3 ubiquitin protein ligase RIN3-like n=1 Tax=Impatiens glandulifera TaxID=253017 RepID=UPI001FB0913D|nr:E3 ubiquitin protein ligase RIN3-like [Impatiens glandulifera]